MMTTLLDLKHKYSWGPIPEWELAKIGKTKDETPADQPKRRGRPPKAQAEQVSDGDSAADSD